MTKIFLVYGTSYDDIDFKPAHYNLDTAVLYIDELNANEGDYWYEN